MPVGTSESGRVTLRSPLTPTEEVVVEQVALGHTTREVARRLGMAYSTVRSHVNNISEKIPSDLQPIARIRAWHRGASLAVLYGQAAG